MGEVRALPRYVRWQTPHGWTSVHLLRAAWVEGSVTRCGVRPPADALRLNVHAVEVAPRCGRCFR